MATKLSRPQSSGLQDMGRRRGASLPVMECYNSETLQDRRYVNLALIPNRKSYMSFRLVPKSVTLKDLERRNDPYLALFYRIW